MRGVLLAALILAVAACDREQEVARQNADNRGADGYPGPSVARGRELAFAQAPPVANPKVAAAAAAAAAAAETRRRLDQCAEGMAYLQRDVGGIRGARRLGGAVRTGLEAALVAYKGEDPEACLAALQQPFAALGRAFTPRPEPLSCAPAIVGTMQQIASLRDYLRDEAQRYLNIAADALEAGDNDSCANAQFAGFLVVRDDLPNP